MKAIVTSISLSNVGSRRIFTLRFPEAMLGDSVLAEVKFNEKNLGIVGLHLGDEIEFRLVPRPKLDERFAYDEYMEEDRSGLRNAESEPVRD